MDNQLTPCPEPKKRAESGKSIAGKHSSKVKSRVMESLNLTTTLNDVFSPDELSLSEDECFVLAEAYVLMEDEYVMWNEDYTPLHNKRMKNKKHSFEEEALSFPLEGSFQA